LKRVFPALLLLATVLSANAQEPKAANAGQANAPRPAGPASTDPLDLPAVTGSNGAQMSLRDCLSQMHACSILAPALHAQVEAQPWSLGDTLTNGIPVVGPKATDPLGCVTDDRWGIPQVICNQGLTIGTTGRFMGASPLFAQAITAFGNGLTPHAPSALNLQYSVFGGSRDFGPGDESDMYVLTSNMWIHSSGNQNLFNGNINGYAPGDSIPLNVSAWSVGQGLAQNEGLEWRSRLSESWNVPQGTLSAKTCGATCTFSLSQTQGVTGSWGNDLALIDVTKGYNSGYISAVSMGIFTGSGTNWDATFGDTTGTTTTTAAVSNASGGNPKLNMFPESNVTISVASSSGFSTGQTACLFDSIDPSWQCSHITAVSDGTHITVDVMNYPLSNGSTVAAGGLTGYGFGMDADWVIPNATNGLSVNGDQPPTGIVRQVYPIVSNASGNTLTIYTPTGVNQNISTRGYHSAAGSGGTASVTVTGGAITSCTATGGSGYNTTNPPSILVTGITSTKAPMVYPTVTSAALSGCTVLYAGAGISGSPIVTVNPNPYHIYPQGRTLNVYNGATGAVDGSAIVTTPVVGAFATGDTLEQPHYFRIKINGMNFAFNNYQAGGQHSNMFFNTGGSFATNDYEANFTNNNDPTLYQNYPAVTTPMPGRGQLGTPYGFVLKGAHRNGLTMSLPPFSNQGSRIGALTVGCGTAAQCAAWNTTYPLLNAQGWNSSQSRQSEDILGYNPVTQTWTLTAGSKGFSGASPSCALSFGPSGLSLTGPGCASHITMRGSAESSVDRPARLLSAVVESRTASASSKDAGLNSAAESDSITINGVACAPGSPCTVLPGSNVPAWLQYLGTGGDGANTDASGALSGEKFYTDFTVPYGRTVTIDASKGGLVVHATGACTIAGSIVATGSQKNAGVTGGSGGGGAVILSSQAKVTAWPAVRVAGGPGALASVPQALATGGNCTSRPKIALGVASGALSNCTVAQAGAGCGAGAGIVWKIVGGGTGGTITATWSGGALRSCTAQGGTGYTAATFATAGAGGDGGNGWSAKFQGW
jgi:hypothetical protein